MVEVSNDGSTSSSGDCRKFASPEEAVLLDLIGFGLQLLHGACGCAVSTVIGSRSISLGGAGIRALWASVFNGGTVGLEASSGT